METLGKPGAKQLILWWGVGWGGLTSLGIILLNWHSTGHLDTTRNIVARVVIFMMTGTLGAIISYKYPTLRTWPNRIPANVRTAIFVVIMAGLTWVLWMMSRT